MFVFGFPLFVVIFYQLWGCLKYLQLLKLIYITAGIMASI